MNKKNKYRSFGSFIKTRYREKEDEMEFDGVWLTERDTEIEAMVRQVMEEAVGNA